MTTTGGLRQRFEGRIVGVGSASGVRVVVGQWHTSPWGPFADAMVETAEGHRVLLAPDERVRDFVAATYSFDEMRVEPFRATSLGDTDLAGLSVRSPSLTLDVAIGRRTTLGRALAPLPAVLTTAPAWCTLTDPVARVLLRGVRTRGSAGNGRREFYGATDMRHVTTMVGSFDGGALGRLAPVDPPCRFGFSSTPRTPSVTSVVTTIDLPKDSDRSG